MSIEEICEKYNIRNYIINDDGSIDVDGDVFIYDEGLTEIPLKFNKVTGSVNFIQNKLTSLEGCPKEVGSFFDCRDNKLTTLEGGPKSVGGDFHCGNNNLTDLKGSPEEIGGKFGCINTNITSFVSDIKKLDGDFHCWGTPVGSIISITDIDFIRTFNTFRVLEDNVIYLKRLKYVMDLFGEPFSTNMIKEHYTIK